MNCWINYCVAKVGRILAALHDRNRCIRDRYAVPRRCRRRRPRTRSAASGLTTSVLPRIALLTTTTWCNMLHVPLLHVFLNFAKQYELEWERTDLLFKTEDVSLENYAIN
jgi:hypothetical protein